MAATSPTQRDYELTNQASSAEGEELRVPSGLRARLRRATQQLLDRLDEHWDNNDTLAHAWPTCC